MGLRLRLCLKLWDRGFWDVGEGNWVFGEIGGRIFFYDDLVLGVEGSNVGIVGSSFR